VRSIFLGLLVSAGCSGNPLPRPASTTAAAAPAITAPAATAAAPSPAEPAETPAVSASPPGSDAVDDSASAGADDAAGAAGANTGKPPDLSQLPRFVPGPVPADHERKLDAVYYYLDPYRRDIGGAVGAAIRVVIELPGSAPARYLLACALAANGFHDDARTVLRALRAAKDCPSCTDALLNAPHDGECEFTPGEVAAANGLKPSAIRMATGSVLGSLISGDAAAAAPYLDASHAAQFSFAGQECDAECIQTEPYTRKAIIDLIHGAAQRDQDHEEYLRPTRLFCDQGCCGGPNPSHSHARRVHVGQMCFSPGPHPLLRSLSAGVDG
jgi:hypothetical protein